jgi:hypothetical protein
MSPAPVRLAFLGVCLLLSLSVAAASGSPVWEKAPSPELLARLRSEWFIPPLPTESEGQVREGQIEECGTKVVWKESGRQVSESARKTNWMTLDRQKVCTIRRLYLRLPNLVPLFVALHFLRAVSGRFWGTLCPRKLSLATTLFELYAHPRLPLRSSLT